MATAARDELTRIFPQWFVSAAEENAVLLGKVMRFSPTTWFFPDCSVNYDDVTYGVQLLVDADSVITDLLANKPGSFHYPGLDLDFPTHWGALSTKQLQDCLWHALDNWFSYLPHRAGFAITMREFNRGEVPGDIRVGCYLKAFSAGHNIQFLTDLTTGPL